MHHNNAYNFYDTNWDRFTFDMAITLPELKEWVKQEYGNRGLADLGFRLERAHTKGHSELISPDLESLLLCNRAGVNEANLSYSQCLEQFLTLPKPIHVDNTIVYRGEIKIGTIITMLDPSINKKGYAYVPNGVDPSIDIDLFPSVEAVQQSLLLNLPPLKPDMQAYEFDTCPSVECLVKLKGCEDIHPATYYYGMANWVFEHLGGTRLRQVDEWWLYPEIGTGNKINGK